MLSVYMLILHIVHVHLTLVHAYIHLHGWDIDGVCFQGQHVCFKNMQKLGAKVHWLPCMQPESKKFSLKHTPASACKYAL